MKNSIGLIVAALVIVLGLFFLSSTGKKPPMIPTDAAHRELTALEACTACHAPGKAAPLRENHPPKEQCLVCHKAKAGKGYRL